MTMLEYETVRECIISKYDHPACDTDCGSNAKGINLLQWLEKVYQSYQSHEASKAILKAVPRKEDPGHAPFQLF